MAQNDAAGRARVNSAGRPWRPGADDTVTRPGRANSRVSADGEKVSSSTVRSATGGHPLA
jgi:hypothetical protein